MQDYFMNNAMKGGWQTPKEIGYGIGLIFDAFKGFPENKHIYVCAHYEKCNDNDGQVTYQMKTTGKMVNEYYIMYCKRVLFIEADYYFCYSFVLIHSFVIYYLIIMKIFVKL